MQIALDSVWDGTDDTPEMKEMRGFFGSQKPTVMEFIEYISGIVDSRRGVKV